MTQIIRTGSLYLLLLGLGLALSPSAQATIKCWRTKQGVRECGFAVPPEYAQSRIEVMNDSGLVVQVIEAAKTQAELVQESKEMERIKAEEHAKAEQRERDRVLLGSYTTERDFLIARDQQLNAAQAIIDLGIGKKSNLQNHLDMLTKRAGDHERSGKPIPPELLNEMKEIKEEIKEVDKYIADKEAEKKKVADKFAADLERFRLLKGIPAKKP